MTTALKQKIDFAVIFKVKNANPNGDPLNGNRPRTTYENFGEVTDVCIKRKIRDRLMEKGVPVFVQSDNHPKKDGAKSLRSRAEKALGGDLHLKNLNLAKKGCENWFDVRAFGQLFAFKKNGKKKGGANSSDGNKGKSDGDTGISIGIRGPVSIQSAFSVAPIDITSTQITKSVNGEDTDDGKRSSDTMGMKHRVDSGIYVFFGSMNPQLAEHTEFSDEDADIIKTILPKLFENDESTARPAGSMNVLKMVWWKHNCRSGQYSSAQVHRSLTVNPDGTYKLETLNGLEPELIDGW
jgi:CRISPR-associated protein Csd2